MRTFTVTDKAVSRPGFGAIRAANKLKIPLIRLDNAGI